MPLSRQHEYKEGILVYIIYTHRRGRAKKYASIRNIYKEQREEDTDRARVHTVRTHTRTKELSLEHEPRSPV